MCLRLTLPRVGDANSAATASFFGDALIGDALIGDALIGDALLGEGSGKSRDDFRGDSRGARGACSSEVNMLMSARGRNGLSWQVVGARYEMRSPTGGANNSVRVPKRPIAPMAPAGRLAVSECFVGVYMTDYDYCELPTLN